MASYEVGDITIPITKDDDITVMDQVKTALGFDHEPDGQYIGILVAGAGNLHVEYSVKDASGAFATDTIAVPDFSTVKLRIRKIFEDSTASGFKAILGGF